MYKYVLQVQKKTTRIASRASCYTKQLYCSSALARVQLWLTLTNANSAENISINYTFCVKSKDKNKQIIFKLYMYRLYYVSMVDIIKKNIARKFIIKKLSLL